MRGWARLRDDAATLRVALSIRRGGAVVRACGLLGHRAYWAPPGEDGRAAVGCTRCRATFCAPPADWPRRLPLTFDWEPMGEAR